MIMRFFFAVGWYLTLAWLHLIDVRIWKMLAPFIAVAIVAFAVGFMI